MRWYLEEYLRFPYGLAPDNATKIELKLQNWGEQLFELVFRSSEKAREFFQVATYDGLHNCELVITSDDPTVLNLPWELLYSTNDRQFQSTNSSWDVLVRFWLKLIATNNCACNLHPLSSSCPLSRDLISAGLALNYSDEPLSDSFCNTM